MDHRKSVDFTNEYIKQQTEHQNHTPRGRNMMSNFTIRKWNSEANLNDDDYGGIPTKSSIANLLNKFLKSRPTKDDLEMNKILKSEYKSIPLRYSLVDILCSHIEKYALEQEGIFRVSGSNQQIRLFWQTFTSDNIEFPINEHNVAGALKLYIREQIEPLIPYEMFTNFINQLGDGGAVTLTAINNLMVKINSESLKIIKRLIRTAVIIVRHSQLNKMDANNMGIVFGPNIFKSKSDSPNIFTEAKYSNESVSFLISNYLQVFPDLEIPILGTETNTEDNDSNNSNSNSNNNNVLTPPTTPKSSTIPTTTTTTTTDSSSGSASSPVTKSIPLSSVGSSSSSTSPVMLSSQTTNSIHSTSPTPFSLTNNNNNNKSNSISNSTSQSKSQLLPIHPSLLDTNQMIERVEGNPLSQMKKQDFSITHHLSTKLQKTKHFKKEEIWDCFLVLKVSGNLVSVKNSSSSTNLSQSNSITQSNSTSNNSLINNGKLKKSTTNLISQSSSTSSQHLLNQTSTTTNIVTLTPVYILITSQNVFFFDTRVYNIQHILPHSRLKEISIDVINKGLFSILDGESHKLSFFLVPRPKIIDLLVRSLERGRAIAKLTNKSLASLQSRKFPLLETNGPGAGGSNFGKLPESRPVFESLAQNGFTELDVWEGTVDLLEVVKKFHHILIPADQSKCVVEFLLPAIPEFKGIYRKSYKLDSKTTVYKIICLICEKAKLEPSKFLLRTLKGRTLFDNKSLGDYGLGTLFTSWQLRLIALESPESTGNFVVEFLMPDIPEFKGMQKKAIKVDAYQPLKRIMKGLCDKLKIPNHHYYHLIGPEGEVLGDNDVLSSIGLGIKYKTCKMKLAKKIFPVGKNLELDTPMVKSLVIDDIISLAWNKIKDRHNERIRLYCKQMLDYIVDQTFVEITKAELVPKRVAMLGKNSRYEFYQALSVKEEEDMILMDIQGYKNTVYQSRSIIPTEPESSPNYPLYRQKLPTIRGVGPITSIRDIKVNSAKNNFLSELKDNNKQQQQLGNGNDDHTIKPSQKIRYTAPTPILNNPNSIVQLLALKPGASKLVEQLKNRMTITTSKINIFDVEDLVPKNSPVLSRKSYKL
ncbi:hypothetical protein RB653_003459 [Dictyostelium firmibasis]|uniref:Rho-GAP domain-containing protein n=1 Tax=Dictyostelium firmibasis TaxID=79012 RepID=A0AAN7TXV3_9MYCE